MPLLKEWTSFSEVSEAESAEGSGSFDHYSPLEIFIYSRFSNDYLSYSLLTLAFSIPISSFFDLSFFSLKFETS